VIGNTHAFSKRPSAALAEPSASLYFFRFAAHRQLQAKANGIRLVFSIAALRH